MEFKTVKELKEAGFKGFVEISSLMINKDVIPDEKGVYMVLYEGAGNPDFICPGTGGAFKGKNPNVTMEELAANWVDNTCVVYIGKAGGMTSSSTLKKRIGQYLAFGKGKPVGHWGGRYIWQLKESCKLKICWKVLYDEEPSIVESDLIRQFAMQHRGCRPFANLRD